MLPPGGEGEVEVTLTPKGNHEDIVKRIVVVSNDPERPKFVLTMQGKLLVDVRAEPSNLNLTEVEPRTRATAKFSVEITDPSKTKLESVEVEDQENFEINALEPDADGRLHYELVFRGSKTVGSFGTRVEVHTSSANTPQLNLPVRVTVVSNLRYSSRLHFSERDGVITPRQLRISTRDGTLAKIGKLDDPDGLLTLSPREPSNATVIFDIAVDPAKYAALPEDQRGGARKLFIHTNDPDQPKLEITYTIGAPTSARARPDAKPN